MHCGMLELAEKLTCGWTWPSCGASQGCRRGWCWGGRVGFQEAWREAFGEADRTMRFVGIRSICSIREALPTVLREELRSVEVGGATGEEAQARRGFVVMTRHAIGDLVISQSDCELALFSAHQLTA